MIGKGSKNVAGQIQICVVFLNIKAQYLSAHFNHPTHITKWKIIFISFPLTLKPLPSVI